MSVKDFDIPIQYPGGWRGKKYQERKTELIRANTGSPTMGFCEIHKQKYKLKYGRCYQCYKSNM